ncbi:hypothetical protein [Peribacillus frigoritolerans]|uniref:hypothetical protein n=1 Tax=Peribacillus frigoritolerans TaxID=450367 RepID=UPI002B247415|nr:hypothetical protein [Peribacillus frigoritolerans]MEB2631898.1 hypothetical protein [Peribacillus frigoritolerans]
MTNQTVAVEGKEMVREIFGVFTNLGIELNFNQNSDNQKQALIEALYKLEGISTIEMKITLNNGTVILPNINNWNHKCENISVFDEADDYMNYSTMFL